METQKDTKTDWSYLSKKTEKLTTALYMVTDIMPSEEPMKWKIRDFGVGILSDIMLCASSSMSEREEYLRRITRGISHVVSYLEVAWTTRMMSEMNAAVLKKEYLSLRDAITKEWEKAVEQGTIITPAFFDVPKQMETKSSSGSPFPAEEKKVLPPLTQKSEDRSGGTASPLRTTDSQLRTSPRPHASIGDALHPLHTVSGSKSGPPASGAPVNVVEKKPPAPQIYQGQNKGQERSFIMRGESNDGGRTFTIQKDALSVPPSSIQKVEDRSVGTASLLRATDSQSRTGSGDRRKIILALLKQRPSQNVKDIAKSFSGVSEKTIQRELLAMVAEGAIRKQGDRRWSTYSLAQ